MVSGKDMSMTVNHLLPEFVTRENPT